MTIRHRITLLVLLMVAAIASIGGYAIYQSRTSAIKVKSVTEGVIPSALASADLVSQLKDVQLAIIGFTFAPDKNIAGQAKEKLTASKALLEKALESQNKGATGNTQRGLVEQARESLDNYFAAIDETISLKAGGKNEIAQANLFGNVVQYQWELEQIVQTLRIEKNRTKDEAITALNDNLTTTSATISIVTAITVIVLSAVGVLLYRRIIGPISRMQAMMTEIAQSQDFTRRVPLDRMDEIGHSIVAFNGMIQKIEESSAMVKQKSADIQSMLQNMQQGILTVIDGLTIHPEYSAYLETILETSDIAGRNIIDLLFTDTNLGADALSQVDAACCACIGEDAMNFDFNVHLLVGEVEKRMPDGRVKILDLIWSPITDEAGTIVRLMLCVREVTELRKLASEASEQKRTLEIIGEILAVSQEKFHEFIVGSMKFINENELIIRQHLEPGDMTIAELFRNMHTIKGNARTYGLHHLTNTVHEAEQTYEELRGPRPNLVWDQGLLLEELGKVRDAVEAYGNINEVSLGRKGAGRRGSVERYLMVDKKHIQETLHRLETVNTSNLHELVAVRDAVRRTLRLLGTETIEETLAGVIDSLPSLARELDKEAPVLTIKDHGFRVRSQVAGTLKNVFMHLIRNAIDHGIETPEVRKLQGKEPAGTIRLELGMRDKMLAITLSDDGRGLALSRIRSFASDRGLIETGQSLPDEEVAKLIFHPGFSTADKVTELSGRGVGMDAVQDFIKREHGKIDIEFADDQGSADYRAFRFIVLLPEQIAVHTGEDHCGDEKRARHAHQAAGHETRRASGETVQPVQEMQPNHNQALTEEESESD